MPVRRVGGRDVAYRVQGHGAPALLLHAALAHSKALAGLMARLDDRLAMVAPDLPGHGRSGLDPDADLQDQALAAAAALLAERPPAHVIGHSFGAAVALRLALAEMPRVASLTLIEPVQYALLAEAAPAAFAAEMAAGGPFRTALAEGRAEAATALFLARWGGPGGLEALAPEAATYVRERIRLIAMSEVALGDPARVSLAQVAQLECPVLLLEGGASPPVVAAIQSTLAAALPAARRVRVPGAGHMLPVTHPDEAAAAIRALVEDVPLSSARPPGPR